jgi:hypothetical protein
MVLPH